MKPLFKIGIALSAVLFLLGIAGVGVGIAMGVTPSQLVYAGHYPGRFSIRSPENWSWDGLSDLDDLDDPDMPSLQGGNPSGSEEYYEFLNIRSLDLALNLCELHVLSHEEDYVSVSADNVKNYFQCRQEGDTLVLTDNRKTSTKSGSMEQALYLDLYLPRQEYEEFELEMGAGNLTLDDLAADEVKIDNGAGSISIRKLSCRELDVDAGVGEFFAGSLEASEEADLDIGTGTAAISRFDGKALYLDCAVGSAEVTAVGREQDYNYRLEASLGSMHINHQLQGREDFHSDSHYGDEDRLDIQNGAGQQIEILCALGTVQLNFTEE